MSTPRFLSHKSSSKSVPHILFLSSLLLGLALALLLIWQKDSRAAKLERTEISQIAIRERPICYLSRSGRHKLRVSDPRLVAQLINQGARLIADYGSFQILSADENTAQKVTKNDSVSFRDEDNLILLNAGTLDTSSSDLQQQRAWTGKFSTGEASLHLIQFAGPVKPEWHTALENTGVKIVSYIPNNAYLVYGNDQALARLTEFASRTEYVQWDGEYKPLYKIDPYIFSELRGQQMLALDEKEELFAIQLAADGNGNQATLDTIGNLKVEPIRSQFEVLNYVNVIVKLPVSAIERQIAFRPDVVSIARYVEPIKYDERQNMILAGNLNGSQPSAGDYLAYLAAQGLTQSQFTASNFAVNVSDSGIDNATTTPNHFALYTGGNVNAASRVIYNRLEGTPNSNSTLEGCDGHGNLNAHIIAGFVPSGFPFNSFPHADASGFRYGLGIAPFVKVGATVIFDPNRYTFPNLISVESKAYNSDARISSNSWGSNLGGAYNIDAQAYDALVRDSQPVGAPFSQAGNQEMVIVFASGNQGPIAGSVGSPGTAKNVITVGAAENVQSIGGADACNVDDNGANNANDMADFSGRGPTSDGRHKPDIVAPGTHITGGVPQFSTASPQNGQASSCYTGAGVCGGVSSIFFPGGQQFYTASSGTSHSTPVVAGAAALLRQRFINAGLNPPSPAMTKAMLMNTARYLNGSNANDDLWSNVQGMGEVNLNSAFSLFTSQTVIRDQIAADTFTATGQTRFFTGRITDTSKPFRVTLAWTDAPGSTIGNAFVNDLNLEVTVNGLTYLGNYFLGQNSAIGGTADNKNNVESVFLPQGVTGTFVIKITAANIAGDGVPNFGSALDQDFALVINYGELTPQAVVTSINSTISAESCLPGNGSIDPGETVTVDFALQNVGTLDTTDLVATLQTSGGIINPSAPQSYGSLTAGGGTVSRSFTFTAAGICGETLSATLTLQDGALNLGSVTFNFPLGSSIVNTATFTNNAFISIPAGAPGITSGQASPYPSQINVTGLSGKISKVTVALNNLSHTFPDDMDLLLISPSGQGMILMSDAGGNTDITNATILFDDTGLQLPDASAIASGTYKPADYGGLQDLFPSPAPQTAFSNLPRLSVFNGANPNGTWSLYVIDDSDEEVGSIQGGWSLTITTSVPVCCSSAGCQPITINPANLPEGTVGVFYSQSFTQNGGTAPISYGLSGMVPSGLTLNGSTLSGFPTQTGDFNLTVTAVDSNGCTGSIPYLLRISCAEVMVTPSNLSNGFVGAVYSQTLGATGGIPPHTYSVSAGSLPGGLNLSIDGTLSGTPTNVGVFNFTVRATDVNGCLGTRQYSVSIASDGLMYYPLPKPIRLFDTRAPIPGFAACEYLSQQIGANSELVKQARLTCDGVTIPANAQAIVGNATVVNPSGGGFITIWPDGQTRPPVSNLNYQAGQTVPNSFTVKLSASGNFRAYSFASTDFIVDITGYFAPPSTGGLYYHSLSKPIRLFDTRAPIPGFAACEYLNSPLVAGAEITKLAQITCDGITIPSDAMAIVGNATVVGPASGGFITMWPDGQPRPPVSTLNYQAGQTVPNAFTASLGGNGQLRVFSTSGTNFFVDITGYYSPSVNDINGSGLLYYPLNKPIRLFDTRDPIPGFPACEYLGQALIAGAELVKQARITCDGVTVSASAQAIVGNATVVQPVANGFITLWPDGQNRPAVSNLNYVSGQTVPNAFTIGLSGAGTFRTFSVAGTQFIVDITGYYAP